MLNIINNVYNKMNKLDEFVISIEKDKYIHIVMSILIFIPVNYLLGPIWGVVAGTLFNAIRQAKDIYLYKKDTLQTASTDFVYGLIGSGLAYLCTLPSLNFPILTYLI